MAAQRLPHSLSQHTVPARVESTLQLHHQVQPPEKICKGFHLIRSPPQAQGLHSQPEILRWSPKSTMEQPIAKTIQARFSPTHCPLNGCEGPDQTRRVANGSVPFFICLRRCTVNVSYSGQRASVDHLAAHTRRRLDFLVLLL